MSVEIEQRIPVKWHVGIDEDGSIHTMYPTPILTEAQKLRLTSLAETMLMMLPAKLDGLPPGIKVLRFAERLRDDVLPILLDEPTEDERLEIVDCALNDEYAGDVDRAYDDYKDMLEERR